MPEDIDMVMCTHLHVTMSAGTRGSTAARVPTFEREICVSKTDYNHFSPSIAIQKGPASMGAFRDSVLPVAEAGAHGRGRAAVENISLERRPTYAYTCSSPWFKSAALAVTSSITDSVYHPTWSSFACLDPVAAVKSRRMLLEKCAGSGALLAPQHFGAPHLCHIDAKGDGFTPRFV